MSRASRRSQLLPFRISFVAMPSVHLTILELSGCGCERDSLLSRDTPSGCLVWAKDAQPKPRRQPSLGRFIKAKPHVDGIAMCIMLGQCLSDCVCCRTVLLISLSNDLQCRAKRSSRYRRR
ncbi:hypothetical protein LX32DRAFT_643232 [Colletotrichum zoysiae]|uniref:Uncharacterized protein n=1 Tax=Colletotrichum zoysiae TaxID=1216348 RepID=A0AAD9HBF6_9PEZI|nr:hypothetical protein LX32DRAFT_643232 [Colletotrichum zoysiae]